MRNRRSLVTAVLVAMSLVFAACGGADNTGTTGDATTAPAGEETTTTSGGTETTPAAEEVTLRVLIHQNPTFTEFMEAVQ